MGSPRYDRCVGREIDARRYREEAGIYTAPTVYPAPSDEPAPSVQTRRADTAGVQVFRDEYGFRYDDQGNRVDGRGNIISPQSVRP